MSLLRRAKREDNPQLLELFGAVPMQGELVLATQRAPDFFRLYDTRLIRRETKDYVPKLIAAAIIAKEPARYGFVPTNPQQPLVYDSIIVPVCCPVVSNSG